MVNGHWIHQSLRAEQDLRVVSQLGQMHPGDWPESWHSMWLCQQAGSEPSSVLAVLMFGFHCTLVCKALSHSLWHCIFPTIVRMQAILLFGKESRNWTGAELLQVNSARTITQPGSSGFKIQGCVSLRVAAFMARCSSSSCQHPISCPSFSFEKEKPRWQEMSSLSFLRHQTVHKPRKLPA